MTTYEDELKKGRFVCSECQKCNKLVWPPSNFCNRCFNEVRWRPVSPVAKLVEFSKKDNVTFCIAEFENTVRIMGTLETDSTKLDVGQPIRLAMCDYNGREKFIFRLME